MQPWPSITAVFDVVAIGSFNTSAEVVALGDTVLQFGRGTARRCPRSKARCRADGIDAVGLAWLIDARVDGEAAGRRFTGIFSGANGAAGAARAL